MGQYRVVEVWINGSEDTTHVRMEVTDQEYKLLKLLKKRVNKAAEGNICMPTIKLRRESRSCVIKFRRRR